VSCAEVVPCAALEGLYYLILLRSVWDQASTLMDRGHQCMCNQNICSSGVCLFSIYITYTYRLHVCGGAYSVVVRQGSLRVMSHTWMRMVRHVTNCVTCLELESNLIHLSCHKSRTWYRCLELESTWYRCLELESNLIHLPLILHVSSSRHVTSHELDIEVQVTNLHKTRTWYRSSSHELEFESSG